MLWTPSKLAALVMYLNIKALLVPSVRPPFSAVFSGSYIRVIKSGGVSAKLNYEECSRKVGLHYSYNYCTNIRLQLFP